MYKRHIQTTKWKEMKHKADDAFLRPYKEYHNLKRKYDFNTRKEMESKEGEGWISVDVHSKGTMYHYKNGNNFLVSPRDLEGRLILTIK